MARSTEYRPEQLVGTQWKPITRAGKPVVCGSKGSALAALQRISYTSFKRAANALQAHEATARVVDEYGAVVWPTILKGYA